MTIEGWKEVIIHSYTDLDAFELLARLLKEYDDARQLLIDKGYRVQGEPLIDVVNKLPSI